VSGEASGLKKERKKGLFDAVLMASGILTSRILGLLRDMALAALFDRTVTDAWTAASRIPNLFRRLFGEGSLAVSFIPVFTEARYADLSGIRARNFVNAFYTLFLVVLATLTLLMMVFAEPIMAGLLDHRFQLQTEKFLMTVRMAKVMFSFVFFVTASAYFAAILNTLGSFGIAALAPTLFNIALLAFTFMPGDWFPQYGDGLAWGVLVGGLLQFGVLALALRAKNYLPQIRWEWGNKDVSKMARIFVPGVVGLGLLQFMTLINLHFASALAEGTISAIYWADRLLEFPISLISVSLGATLLPRLSEMWVQNKNHEMAQNLEDHLLLNIFLALPSAAGLFLLSGPMVVVLFQRGHFDSHDAQATTWVLQLYAIMLLSVAVSRVVVVAYYAVQRTLYPAVAVLGGLILHLCLAPVLMPLWGLRGLIGSSMAASFVSLAFLLIPLSKWAVALNPQRVWGAFFKMLLATLGMSLVLWTLTELFQFSEIQGIVRALNLGICLFVGVGSYFLFSYFLQIPEARSAIAALRRKIKK
jgi:putative peptidoglycan lipid II flippase